MNIKYDFDGSAILEMTLFYLRTKLLRRVIQCVLIMLFCLFWLFLEIVARGGGERSASIVILSLLIILDFIIAGALFVSAFQRLKKAYYGEVGYLISEDGIFLSRNGKQSELLWTSINDLRIIKSFFMLVTINQTIVPFPHTFLNGNEAKFISDRLSMSGVPKKTRSLFESFLKNKWNAA